MVKIWRFLRKENCDEGKRTPLLDLRFYWGASTGPFYSLGLVAKTST